MFIHLDSILWLFFGFLTVYLMYGRKEEIPVVKSVGIIIFGGLSFVIWCLSHITGSVPNPMVKRVEHHVVPIKEKCKGNCDCDNKPSPDEVSVGRRKQSKRL